MQSPSIFFGELAWDERKEKAISLVFTEVISPNQHHNAEWHSRVHSRKSRGRFGSFAVVSRLGARNNSAISLFFAWLFAQTKNALTKTA